MIPVMHLPAEAAFASHALATAGQVMMDSITYPQPVIVRALVETEVLLTTGIQQPTTRVEILQRNVPRKPQDGDIVKTLDVFGVVTQTYTIRAAQSDGVQAKWILDVDNPQ